MKEVKGKVAVVTGAASGIGRGMVQAFVEAGMRVVLSDVEERALESTTNEFRDRGAEVLAVVTDVSDASAVEALAKRSLEAFGAVHVLCNNAGVAGGGVPSWRSTLEDWEWMIGVNLMGVVHGVRTFLPIMIDQDQEAHIVNTSSMAGLTMGGDALYGAVKAAIVSFTENTYLEILRGGFAPRMSLLCPGYVDTNILNAARNRPARLANAGPLPRGPEFDMFMEWFADRLKRGLSARAVGDKVLKAIIEERFYILTDSEWDRHIEQRMKQLLSRENPIPMLPPGL